MVQRMVPSLGLDLRMYADSIVELNVLDFYMDTGNQISICIINSNWATTVAINLKQCLN